MDESVDIRFLINSSEVERESQRSQKAIEGIGGACKKVERSATTFFDGAASTITESIRSQKRAIAELEKQYKQAQRSLKKVAPGVARESAARELVLAKKEIDAEREALKMLEAEQAKFKQQETSLRTLITQKRNELARMTEGTREYRQAMQELGKLQDRYGDVQTQGRIFADDNRNIRATTDAVQGLSGAMSAGMGIATLFGASQENLAKTQARLQAVMAVSIGVNQVAQTLNKDSYFTHIILAKAKDTVTAATNRLSVALGISSTQAKVLMGTLTLGLSVAITAVISALGRWQKRREEIIAQNKTLHTAIAQNRIDIAEEIAQIDKSFAALNRLKEGTKGYGKAKDDIISKYGKYLNGLDAEIRSLRNVAGAYDAVKRAARESMQARAKTAFIEDSTKEANEKMGKALGKIRDNLTQVFDKEFLEKYPDQISSIMAEVTDALVDPSGDFTSKYKQVADILVDHFVDPQKVHKVLGSDLTEGFLGFAAKTLTFQNRYKDNFVQDFVAAYDQLIGINDIADRVFTSATPSEEEVVKNKEYWTRQRDAAQAALDAMADSKKGTKEWNDELEKLNIANLKLKLYDFTPKEQNKYFQAALEAQIAIENARIEAMQEGKTKRIAMANSEYREQIVAINKEERKAALEAKKNGKTLPDDQKEVFAAQRTLAASRRDSSIYAAEKEYYDKTSALYDELADVFLNDEQRKTKAIKKRFDELRNQVNDAVLAGDMAGDEAMTLYGKINNAEQHENLKIALDQFKTYQTKAKELTEKYQAQITGLRAAGYEAEAQEAEKQLNKELKALSASMLKESDLWVQIFANASLKSVDEIKKLISQVQGLYNYLSGTPGAVRPTGFSDEQLAQLKGNPEALKAVQDALKGLYSELGKKSPFDQFAVNVQNGIDKIKNAFGPDGKGVKDVSSGITIIRQAFAEFAPELKKFGDNLGNIFGDDLGEVISQVVDLYDSVLSIGDGLARIASGDIFGGITAAVSGLATIFSMASAAEKRHQEALEKIARARLAQQREYNKLLMEQNLLYEQGKSVFGTDEIGHAVNALENYRKAIELYRNELQGTKPARTLWSLLNGRYQRQLEAYNAGFGALNDIEIVTGHKKTGLFGWGKGKDIYTPILEVYPDLITAEGELNKERAQAILNTQQMSDENKSLLQSLIDLQDQAEEATAELESYLSGTFGELGTSIMDTIASAIKSGSDAWREFGDVGASVLENLGKQIAYELFFSAKFKQLEEDLKNIYGSGMSTQDIATAARDTVTQFYATISDDMQAAQKWLEQWGLEAQKQGLDLWTGDQSAMSGGIQAQLTEKTGTELMGCIRLQTDKIIEMTAGVTRQTELSKTGWSDVAEILSLQVKIENNTRRAADNTAPLPAGIEKILLRLRNIDNNTTPKLVKQ